MASGILSGRYEIGERLGSGGMSSVHQATDLILERTVAVKILAEHLSDDERFVARFRREALAVAKLIHPNIVQVYDTGIDDGRHYIVMEYVQGRSGAQILQRHGPLDAETTAEIGAQACAGLDYAHRRGIIHRDVKPGNLMIVGGPVGGGEMTMKLTDFGIARAVEQTRITQVGSVVGTAAYLSPEQVRGEEATPATDVYALGVVLYQFLTGRLPYEGSTLAELAVRQQNEKPLPPSTYNDEVPGTLGAAVLRALEGDPNRRYASASEFAGGLALGMQGEDVTLPLEEGTAATNVLGGGETATRRLDQTAQTEYRPAQPSPTRRPVARAPQQQAPPPPIRPAAQAQRKRGAFSRFARFVMALIALVLIAAAVAAAVIYATDKATGVKATEVAGNTVDKVVEEFKDLVKKNQE
ncbi:MAG TPA: protein kinase [Solirubrobacterales bacterium]|jgi:serine/threonine-protein kinase|nr:protein kinase [Solirubrobacterales bacterium]